MTTDPKMLIDDPDLARSMYEQLHAEITQRLDLRQGILTFTLLLPPPCSASDCSPGRTR